MDEGIEENITRHKNFWLLSFLRLEKEEIRNAL